MANHLETGKRGEELAVACLLGKGHIILEQNYRYRRSEIDIISTYNGILTFTEVKTRHGGADHHPSHSVSRHKQTMLKAGATQYMEDNQYEWAIQFDIITIILHDTTYELEHYEDAFF